MRNIAKKNMNSLSKDYFDKNLNFFDFSSPYVRFDFTAYRAMSQGMRGFVQICAMFMFILH